MIASSTEKPIAPCDDPATDPDEIVFLSKTYDRAYANPGMPWRYLFQRAMSCPWYVDKNPSLDLLALADPREYQALQETLESGWRVCVGRVLSRECYRFYVCDCAEQALPAWTAVYPENNVVAIAIATARSYAEKKASLAELQEAHDNLCFEKDKARTAARKEKSAAEAPVILTYWAMESAFFATAPNEEADEYHRAKAALKAAQYACCAFETESVRDTQGTWQASRAKYWYTRDHWYLGT